MTKGPSVRRGLLPAAILLTVLSACTASPTGSAPTSSGSSPSIASPPAIDLSAVPARVHAESAGATSAWIGPAGGTLSVQAADGTAFELDIPELAVREPTPITMAPIASVDDLGLSGGFAGAVYLGPAGLRLAVPATLKVTSSKSAPSGTRLVGFDIADDGTTDLVPAVPLGGQLTAQVFHFSAPGVGFGTSTDLQKIFQPLAGGSFSTELSAWLAEDVPWGDVMRVEALKWIEDTWNRTLKPELSAVADDAKLRDDLADWRQFVFMLNLYSHRGLILESLNGPVGVGDSFPVLLKPIFIAGQELIGKRIADAIDGNKALCASSHDLGALANTWYWAGVGNIYVPLGDWRERAIGCGDLAIAVANLPTTLTADTTGTVFLQFEMAFADGTKLNVDVEAGLVGTGFIFGRTGSADARDAVAAGHTIGEPVSGQQAGPYSLDIHACWSYGGLVRALCKDFQQPFGVSRTAGPIPTASAGIGGSIQGRYQGTVTYADGTVIDGSASIGGSEAQGDIFLRPGAPFANTLNCQWTLSPGVKDLGGSFGRTLPSPCSGVVSLTPAEAEQYGDLTGAVGGGTLQFTQLSCRIAPDPNPGCQTVATWVLTKVQ